MKACCINPSVAFSMGGQTPYSENMEQLFAVQLVRGARGFGFSIRGGKEFQNMPLFVLRLAEDGPASLDGRMQVKIHKSGEVELLLFIMTY